MSLTISLVFEEEKNRLLSSDWDTEDLLNQISKYYIIDEPNSIVLAVTDEDDDYLYCYVVYAPVNCNGELTLSKKNAGRLFKNREIDFTNDLYLALDSLKIPYVI